VCVCVCVCVYVCVVTEDVNLKVSCQFNLRKCPSICSCFYVLLSK